MSASDEAVSPAGPSRNARRRRLAFGCLVVVVVLVAAWTAVEVWRAVDGARTSQTAATGVQRALSSRDWSAISTQGHELSGGVDQLASAMSSPPLRVAGFLPLVGRDVRATREVALGLREASQGLQPLMRSTGDLQPSSLMKGGRVDVQRIRALAPAAARADRGLTSAARRINQVRADSLHAPLRRHVIDLQGQLTELQHRSAIAASAAEYLPAMLGADGRRSYLVAFQNLAEARPTGGIFGSYGVLVAEDGRLTLAETGVNDDLGQLTPADLDGVDPDLRRLYDNDLALSQNFNLSPDFPVAAQLFERLWERGGHPRTDGVLSLDPIVLQGILRGTGPVRVAGGPQLTGDNAGAVLMEQIYRTLGGNTRARNAYLQASVAAVFEKISTTSSDGAMWSALAADDVRQHIMMWSAQKDENAFLDQVGLSGALPPPQVSAVGAYVTNVDASKLDYFLHRSVSVEGACGTPPRVVVRLRNAAPSTVPDYSTNKLAGTRLTDHTVTVALMLPPQRGLSRLTVDGDPVGLSAGVERGWSVARATVTVPRGETAVIAAQLTGSTAPVTTVLAQPAATPLQLSLGSCVTERALPSPRSR